MNLFDIAVLIPVKGEKVFEISPVYRVSVLIEANIKMLLQYLRIDVFKTVLQGNWFKSILSSEWYAFSENRISGREESPFNSNSKL